MKTLLHIWSRYWPLIILVIAFMVTFYQQVFGGFIDLDSQAFSAQAWHMLHGKVLYKDIWASKPPGVYSINVIALWLFGSSQTSIWIIQLLLGCVSIISFYQLSNYWFPKNLHKLLFTALFANLIYFTTFYSGGNFTEEYALCFQLLGILFLANWHFRKKKFYIAFSGFFLACTTLLKEPWLFTILPWLVLFFVLFWQKKDWKSFLQFTIGALIPILVFAIYLKYHNAFADYYKHIVYNIAYAHDMKLSLFQKFENVLLAFAQYAKITLISIALVLAILVYTFKKLTFVQRGWLLVLLADFVLGWLSISLSGYQFKHYYLQILFSGFMLLVLPTYWWIQLSPGKVRKSILTYALILAFYSFSITPLIPKKGLENISERNSSVSAVIGNNTSMFIEDLEACHLYLGTKNISNQTIPVTFFSFFMVQDKYVEERIEKFIQSFQKNPPEYILFNEHEGIIRKHQELNQWFKKNYTYHKSVINMTIFTFKKNPTSFQMWEKKVY